LTSEAPALARGAGVEASTDFMVGSRRFAFAPHNCFACGQLNAHGLHLVLHGRADGCWTELSLPERFEGWEGIAHGGILAAILDEVMAWALVGHDSWGLTARLSIEFKRPVPIGEPIRAEGWITEARRRLLRTQGHILDGVTGAVLATGEALYVAADERRKQELKARYQFRLVDEPAAPGTTGAARAGSRP
jgi:acyl-CoA hydrolase